MNKLLARALGALLLGCAVPLPAAQAAEAAPARIVSIGGPVTEIVYALGRGGDLVGADTSSLYPAEATRLPQVGYQRNLSAEGVLGLRPTLILASVEAGPPPVVAQLRQSGVPWVAIPADPTPDGARAKIRAVAQTLGLPAEGEKLVRALDARLGQAQAAVAANAAKPKVLFIYARGGGVVNVAGRGTAADAVIALAGGVNAVGGYDGYKPVTAEGVVAAAPDVILIPQRGLESVGGVDGLLKQPGLAATPAGRTRRVVAMDDLLLLGFGPRLGDAVLELADLLRQPSSAP